MKVFDPKSGHLLKEISVEGSGTIPVNKSVIDMEITHDDGNLDITIHHLNASILSTQKEILIKPVSPHMSSINVLRAYRVELPSDLPFETITLKIKYSDKVSDTSNVFVYKCSNYDEATQQCNEAWIKLVPSFENGYARVEISSFSVYALGENQETTTTTLQSSSSSSSSGTSSTSSEEETTSGGGGGFTITSATNETEEEEMEENVTEELMCEDFDELNVEERGTCTLDGLSYTCLLYTSPSPRDLSTSRMPSSA